MAIGLLPRASAPMTAGVVAAVLVSGLLPVAFMLATGRLVGAITRYNGTDGLTSGTGRAILAALGLAVVLFIASQVMEPFRLLLAQRLGRRLDLHLRARVMRATLAPTGIGHLEDPAKLDTISLARGVGPGDWTPAGAVVGLAGIASNYVQGLSSAVVLGRYWWWLALILVVVNVFIRLRFRDTLIKIVDVMIGEARALRRTMYYRDLSLTAGAAKEVRVFGLRAWIGDRFRSHWYAAMREVWRQRASSRPAMVMIIAGFAAAHIGALAVVARAAVRGEIDVAALAVMTQSVFGVGALGNIDDSDTLVIYGVAAIPSVAELERVVAEEARAALPVTADPAGLPVDAIRFEGVRFTYPGRDEPVYEGLDLTIPAGRSLAIVGANGAGKTTLVKLLARLYEPQAGSITTDGIDIRAFDARAWQRRIAAIFQDFVQYPLSAADNIGIGVIERIDDRVLIEAAARRAGAHDIIEALPHGWDTLLSRQFREGADLSGGQWQRIALARALFAVAGGSSVLVLDEPTANLDVRAEVALFDRFLDLTRGLTTILISHRFSTVRRADRIVVLDGGKVSEEGTHDELMALGGTYATMFGLQAARFAEPVEA
ncbi:MAG TPA: ABC transporter ATP-binding protein [Actinomycetota bacterium]|nr:ABC transporter ATP-binding protein [Actinomycetota bacterium]